jgi:iron complex transport system ATP-binding protein
VVALVGPNGAGKSTLLRVLSGDLQLASGLVALKGKALSSYAPAELARHRAVLSQHTVVAFPFTVGEIVRMGAASGRGHRWVEQAARQVMARCDVAHLEHRAVTRLSGGEQQRVHLARTLLQLASAEEKDKPSLLMLDEPTASLDLKHQLHVLEVSKEEAAKGVGVIVVIHDLNLAAMLATRVVMLKGGRIIADGPVRDVISNRTIEAAFGVTDAAGVVPRDGLPFVLPQSMRHSG